MSEPAFDPTPRPALQPRPTADAPEPGTDPEPVVAPLPAFAPAAEPAPDAEPESPVGPAPAVKVRIAEPGKKKPAKKRKVDGKRFGRGSTADTQVAPKAKRVKLKVDVPKFLRTELAEEAAQLGISVDDYVTNILRSR